MKFRSENGNIKVETSLWTEKQMFGILKRQGFIKSFQSKV